MRMIRKKNFLLIVALVGTLASYAQSNVETQRQYLSGHGCDDMVQWDFKCTDGRNSGSWTKIGVPSCWELQGFGTYQYGMRFYGKEKPEGIADEKGFYKYEFTLPKEWEGRQIELVFEAVFTDAKVTINGRKAGSGLHQGGFCRFTFDVSDRIYFGNKKNRLEVEVSKESANGKVNMAERRADYWNFGGIWRPVFIVAKPVRNIDRVAVNADMNGRFRADVFLSRTVSGGSVCVDIIDAQGKKVTTSPAAAVNSDHTLVDFNVKNPKLWTAETPNLYTAVFTLKDAAGKTLHVERQKFGFRTIEYRHSYQESEVGSKEIGSNGQEPGVRSKETGCHVYGCDEDGLFINGKKVIVKGVNRHSFRPETGRTLSKEKNIEDVKLIKSMNMNAVRLSHYPADPEFLDACDSLGLYVENELPGWHWAHETIIGQQLVREMVTRDVNHPSVIFWSNGNEGGFNYELDGEFGKWDPQNRVVLYPWANRNGFETKHYRSWGETAEFMRQKEIFMPTEFLHGLYDGGHGAGLKDYWALMMSNPRCAGGFLWDLMDQGVVRTDRDNIVDCMGNFGADGIVGPHMEKEGSFYTIRDIWSPVQIAYKEENDQKRAYLYFTNKYDFTTMDQCKFTYKYLQMPELGQSEVKTKKEGVYDARAWRSTIDLPAPLSPNEVLQVTGTDPFGREINTWSFYNRLFPSSGNKVEWTKKVDISETDSELIAKSGKNSYVFSKTDGRLKYVKVDNRIVSFGNGPRFVAAKRSDRSQDGFYNHDDKDAFNKKTQYTEYADQGRFAGFSLRHEPKTDRLIATYQHGSLQEVQWSFAEDGTVGLTISYAFNGVVDIMGICFDYPEQFVKSKSWVGKGPYRVWQNRLEGPKMGYWHNAYNDPIPGESWDYPEFKGYFADVKWMQLQTKEGKISVNRIGILPDLEPMYVGVYQPRDGRDQLLYDLPQTGLSVLQVIPAVRNKVNTTDLNGPSAQPYCTADYPDWTEEPRTLFVDLKFE